VPLLMNPTAARHILLLLFLLAGLTSRAQRTYYNWYFGSRAGLTFNTSPPTALTQPALTFAADAACISDSAGRFLFATDGRCVWDRTGQVMAGGDSINVNGYPATPVLAVRQPGSSGRYYIFRDGADMLNQRGIGYSVVDMRRNGGRGEVLSRDSLREWQTPYFSSGNLRSRIVAVRHANGRDVWVVWYIHNQGYGSCLLSSRGVGPVQLDSRVLPRAQLATGWTSLMGFGRQYLPLKASFDGRRLAVSLFQHRYEHATAQIELADFDPAAGRVTASFTLPDSVLHRRQGWLTGPWETYFSGLEFSPDGSRLYADTVGGSVQQYNLLAGNAAAIAASRRSVGSAPSALAALAVLSDLQLGPDGRIYCSNNARNSQQHALACIETPNALGPACGYHDLALNLGPAALPTRALPLSVSDHDLPPVVIDNAGELSATPACAGDTVLLRSSLSPFVTATAYEWNFDDPAAGPANTAAGQAPTHSFRLPGTYQVSVRVITSNGAQFTSRLPITIADCSFKVPNVITPNGDAANQHFVLQGLVAPDWSLAIYNRWGREVYQQEKYDNTWAAEGQPDGVYYYYLHNARTGQHLKGWVEVLR
jgi:gliding motility-associated-like protein